MPKKTFTPEQIVGKLWQIEVLVSQGDLTRLFCTSRIERSGYRSDARTNARQLAKINPQNF
jgi:hypothetical protein